MSKTKIIKQKLKTVAVYMVNLLSIVYLAMFGSNAMAADDYDFENLVSSGDSIIDVNKNIENVSNSGFNMIKVLGVFVGICFIFAGLLRLKKSQDQNSGVSPMQGIGLLLIGGLFGVLPWLLKTSSTTVSQTGQ
ncbi:TPA: hypothetical protein ACJEU7_001834 [Acinetobacter baumannii]|uniref:hypothetical protein n=1 Tax=Acinetobacter baumannii TaxID=470 RepID=UPI0008DE1191|nr:hypothetical protein [Acinetobacter baumannii]MCX3034039.1 hypothetical protein [Acinetobacter baumannii]OIH08594.1 hypothetical protein A7M79_07205 [Acinetobacter baumannii]